METITQEDKNKRFAALEIRERQYQQQILEIVECLYKEVNALREEVLRGETVTRESTSGKFASDASTSGQLQKKIDSIAVSNLKAMLNEVGHLRLSDEEMLKLATLSKLKSECQQRSEEREKERSEKQKEGNIRVKCICNELF